MELVYCRLFTITQNSIRYEHYNHSFACSVICDVMYIIIHFMRKLLVKLYFKARALLTHSGMGCLAIIVYLLRNASLEKSTCDLDVVGIQVGQTYASLETMQAD